MRMCLVQARCARSVDSRQHTNTALTDGIRIRMSTPLKVFRAVENYIVAATAMMQGGADAAKRAELVVSQMGHVIDVLQKTPMTQEHATELLQALATDETLQPRAAQPDREGRDRSDEGQQLRRLEEQVDCLQPGTLVDPQVLA